MPWQIKTRLNQALRSILGLIDYPKKMYVSPHLLSTINYQELMSEIKHDIRTSVDATTTINIGCPVGYKIRIEYGRIKYTAAAAVANRTLSMAIVDTGSNYEMAHWEIENPITSGQTKWILLSYTNYQGDTMKIVSDPIISMFETPHWITEKDKYYIQTTNSQVGDTFDLHLRIKYVPVKEDWQQ